MTPTSVSPTSAPAPPQSAEQNILNGINEFISLALAFGAAFIKNPSSAKAQHINTLTTALVPLIPVVEAATVSVVNSVK